MMNTIRLASLIMLLGATWLPSVSAAPLLFEDFESVATPGEDAMPAGWINSREVTLFGGEGSTGTVDVGGDVGGYMRGPATDQVGCSGSGSNSVDMIGVATPFAIGDSLSCTYTIYKGIPNGIVCSWADEADGTNSTPGGGPFHQPDTVQRCQCDDGTPPSTGPTCPNGGQAGENQNSAIFRAIAITRGRIGATYGRVVQCNGDGWTTTQGGDAPMAFEDAFRAAEDKATAITIKVTLADPPAVTSKVMVWKTGAGAFQAGTDDTVGSVCGNETMTQVGFTSYAGGIIIDDVIVENNSNQVPVELSTFEME
jgi:hypothetical protein